MPEMDYRDLLKKSIRGQVFDGIVSLPAGNEGRGESANEAELAEFGALAREVYCEEAIDAFSEDGNRIHIQRNVDDFNGCIAPECRAKPIQVVWFSEKSVVLL